MQGVQTAHSTAEIVSSIFRHEENSRKMLWSEMATTMEIEDSFEMVRFLEAAPRELKIRQKPYDKYLPLESVGKHSK